MVKIKINADQFEYHASPMSMTQPTKTGYLWKQGEHNSSWRRRYFVMKGNILYYYETEEAPTPLGLILLEDVKVRDHNKSDGGGQAAFAIDSPGRSFLLAASSEESMMAWMTAIGNASCALAASKAASAEEKWKDEALRRRRAENLLKDISSGRNQELEELKSALSTAQRRLRDLEQQIAIEQKEREEAEARYLEACSLIERTEGGGSDEKTESARRKLLEARKRLERQRTITNKFSALWKRQAKKRAASKVKGKEEGEFGRRGTATSSLGDDNEESGESELVLSAKGDTESLASGGSSPREPGREEDISLFNYSQAAAADMREVLVGSQRFKIFCGSWNMGAKDPWEVFDEDAKKEIDLTKFIPKGYDIYAIGIQEGVNDNVFDKIEEAIPDIVRVVVPKDSNKVYGRGDGSFTRPKFTGIVVFVSREVLGGVKLLKSGALAFGAAEGSKGVVGVVLEVGRATVAFMNCHLAANSISKRLNQYSFVLESMGSVLGIEFCLVYIVLTPLKGFSLFGQFHHLFWMGDMNFRLSKVSATTALKSLSKGDLQELRRYDELLQEIQKGRLFCKWREPQMRNDFYPTYKKFEGRTPSNYSRKEWPNRVYRVQYKEPFYKGGRVKTRVPAWCDRILYHNGQDLLHAMEVKGSDKRSDRQTMLLPSQRELLVSVVFPEKISDAIKTVNAESQTIRYGSPVGPEELPEHDNYGAVMHEDSVYTISDHTPVYATFDLSIRPKRHSSASTFQFFPHFRLTKAKLLIQHSECEVHSDVPHTVRVMFPAPYEDHQSMPDVRVLNTRGSSQHEWRANQVNCIDTFLESHLIVRFNTEDLHGGSTAGQCVVSMAELISSAEDREIFQRILSGALPDGRDSATRFPVVDFCQVLYRGGLPLRVDDDLVKASFSLRLTLVPS